VVFEPFDEFGSAYLVTSDDVDSIRVNMARLQECVERYEAMIRDHQELLEEGPDNNLSD
jgi:hypothetical protein